MSRPTCQLSIRYRTVSSGSQSDAASYLHSRRQINSQVIVHCYVLVRLRLVHTMTLRATQRPARGKGCTRRQYYSCCLKNCLHTLPLGDSSINLTRSCHSMQESCIRSYSYFSAHRCGDLVKKVFGCPRWAVQLGLCAYLHGASYQPSRRAAPNMNYLGSCESSPSCSK